MLDRRGQLALLYPFKHTQGVPMKFIAVFIFLLQSSFTLASEALSTNSFATVFEKLEEKAQEYGRDKVLLVLDIDNTILTMNNDLGSDQWFSWQEEVMKQEGCEPVCVSRDLNKLLDAQGILFTIGTMSPTESSLPEMIQNVQKQNQKIILLTSRGSEIRNITEKTLEKNGYDFSKTAVGDSKGVAGTYLPYDIKNYACDSLTAEDIRVANLKEARPVSYQNGVYMTSGQNKGIMLKVFLNKFKSQYKAVVFVDDHQRHVDRMQAILGAILDVTTYRYGGVDDRVEQFKQSDKKAVVEKWLEFKKVIHQIGFTI